MPVFAVICGRGPAWDATRRRREQDGWTAHAAYMEALVVERFILLEGPLGSGERFLVVVEAADEGEVRARLSVDPWARYDILRLLQVEPWEVVFEATDRWRRRTGNMA